MTEQNTLEETKAETPEVTKETTPEPIAKETKEFDVEAFVKSLEGALNELVAKRGIVEEAVKSEPVKLSNAEVFAKGWNSVKKN